MSKKALLFDRHSGAIIGYADVGDTTILLDTLEKRLIIQKDRYGHYQKHAGNHGARYFYKSTISICV